MIHDNLCHLGIKELHDAFKTSSLSPVDVAEAFLARIDALNPRLNAFCHLDRAVTLSMACESAARWRAGVPLGLLDGIPAGIKDTVEVKGWPLRKGSLTTNSAPSATDSLMTARMRSAGVVFLGKTTTPEFMWKGVTDSQLMGVTRNPFDLGLTPGGSSGGSSAALAAGMCVIATGGDAGGSVRIPASFTGTASIKPGVGLIPAAAGGATGDMATQGAMASRIEDAALLLQCLSGPHHSDPISMLRSAFSVDETPTRHLECVKRVAYSTNLGFVQPIAPDLDRVFRAKIEQMRSLFPEVEEVSPDLGDPRETMRVIARTAAALTVERVAPELRDRMDPELLAVAHDATAISGLDVTRAQARRSAISASMGAFHEKYQLLITPALPITAFEVGRLAPASSLNKDWIEWAALAWPFNLTRQPAAVVRCGVDGDGLPFGIQIVGTWGAENLVLAAAAEIERLTAPIRPMMTWA